MGRPSKITIDKNALVHNVQRVKHYAPESRIIAMLKANAYGHGIDPVSQVLADHVDAFGVACIEEALAIRQLGIQVPIILMEGVFDVDELSVLFENNFEIAIHNHQQLELLKNCPLSKPIKVWVKLDTGMHRLGFCDEDTSSIYEQLKTCAWVDGEPGLMTHFSCADDIKSAATNKQISLFEQSIQGLPKTKRSLANSAGIIAWPQSHAEWVRPGIMLYGISPFTDKTGSDYGLQAVMQLHSQIIAIKHCKKGDAIGYGATWHCPKDCIIGVIAVGYGDGYPRHMQQGAPVLVNNKRVPLVGRVSMDMITVDLSEQPNAKVGDPVECWGAQLPIEEVALHADTIAYEIVCQISDRVR